MLERDVRMFLDACEMKGLSRKTIGSYEQTLRLFMQHLDRVGIQRTEDVTHLVIQEYIKEIKIRGKYTVTTNDQSGNYPERRVDYGNKVSEVTINNYLRNLRVFFNWCVEEELLRRSPGCATKHRELLSSPSNLAGFFVCSVKKCENEGKRMVVRSGFGGSGVGDCASVLVRLHQLQERSRAEPLCFAPV